MIISYRGVTVAEVTRQKIEELREKIEQLHQGPRNLRTVMWTGKANDANFNNPENWEPYGVPEADKWIPPEPSDFQYMTGTFPVLTTSQLTEEETATLRAEIEKLYVGPRRDGEIIAIPDNITVIDDEADSPIIVER